MTKKEQANQKTKRWPILAILLLALVLRLYHFSHPLADWHSFRQADTASVTREYVKAGSVNLLEPRYHDLSNIQSGQINPEGYRMVEFPIINGLIAQTIIWGQKLGFNLDLVKISRLFSILASLVAIFSLYQLLIILNGKKLALTAALIYAILPYAVFYGRTILPEPFMLAFSLFSLWQWALFCLKRKEGQPASNPYLLSLIALALALLLKPFVAVLAPVYLAIAWYFLKSKALKTGFIYFYPILAIIPFFLWRNWIENFPAGIPGSDWLFNGNSIRLRPAWFRWLFYERLTKLFFGYTGLILLLANSCKTQKACLIYFSWWFSLIVYFIVIATGNVQHDYYQNLAIPIVSIAMARGLLILEEKIHHWRCRYLLLALILASSLFFSGRKIIGNFNVNHWEYVKAGQAVDRLVAEDALVIAPAMGDTVFLFQTNRRGWPIGFYLESKIEQGASIYVSVNDDDERRQLEAIHPILEKNELYSIIDLTQEKP